MIIDAFLALFIATAISFAGSVQLGPVNFGTIYTALNKDKKSAILFGLGGSLPELLYCGLAIFGSNFLNKFEGINTYLSYLTSGVLLVFGMYLLLSKSADTNKKYAVNDKGNIWKGALFGLLNPQLFPFWLFIITYLRANEILVLTHWSHQLFFAFGTSLGAFLLQLLVAEVASRKREYLFMKVTKSFNKWLGAIILSIAIIQLIIRI